ncbi:Adenylate kinase 8 [Entophlyctis luteolus]|nr:Adenylate kinase 8 [Entophlyctis luteolus]
MEAILDPTKTHAFAAYADYHDLFGLFESLVKAVVVDMPADPLQAMIDKLKQPTLPAVMIMGPPRCGIGKLAKQVAQTLNCVFVSMTEILITAVERQTSLGQQARAHMEAGRFVPDQVVLNLFLQRLQEPDVMASGFVAEGFPATKEQALAMQAKVVIDCDDKAIIEYNEGIRTDPVQKRDYHDKYDAPPADDAEVIARLIHRPRNSAAEVSARLAHYRRHATKTAGCFSACRRRLAYMDAAGVWGRAVGQVCADVAAAVAAASAWRSRAPRQFKIVLQGLPGSGRASVAQRVEAAYGFVHVSPRKVILEEVSAKSRNAKNLLEYLDDPAEAPEEIMLDLIIKRLQRDDCVNKGWVLEGFPNTRTQAAALKEKGIVPNRLIWLRASPEACRARLVSRRQDPLTGRLANLEAPPSDVATEVLNAWPPRNTTQDSAESVELKIQKQINLKSELEGFYGHGATTAAGKSSGGAVVAVAAAGIMQEVEAGGIGERDAQGRHRGLERVLELVDDALLKPVPGPPRASPPGPTVAVGVSW